MKKLVSLALACLLAVALAACGSPAGNTPESAPGSTPASSTPLPESTPESTPDSSAATDLTTDRAGNPITPPAQVNGIVSMAASTTRTLYDLGLADKLVAIDTYSAANLPEDMAAELPQLDMMAPDLELLASLAPDIIFVSPLSSAGGEDIYAPLRASGTCVAEVPSPDSIAGIFEDVQFIAALCGEAAAGTALVAGAQTQLDEIAALVATTQDRPGVYFEVSPAPNCYSTGSGTYLNEMIALAGGTNVFEDQESWIGVTEESIVLAAPDVIFTVADYLEDPVGEILARTGWETIPAVESGAVALISPADSQQPTTHVVDAVWAMLAVIHPELSARQAA
ncbi:MAG: ABC transporter substrate-binding protein [Ruminococcaceae bacterium]|nr:ABC transporter substrate-binding protein [Oscillospiraceae bacterium]